jgi:hypothetical protein
MRRPPDIVSLVAGLVIAALGTLLLLDQLEALELRFAYGGPALLAAAGAILLVNGLSRPRGRR